MSEIDKVFKFQDSSINVLGSFDKPMFFGKQIAQSLGYIKPRNAVAVHVWECNKMTLSSYKSIGPAAGRTDELHPNTTIINEAGVFQLIFASKLEKAKEFQKWVLYEVLPSIRKTGSYQLVPSLKHNQFVILNERDLHENVVSYIRRFYPDVIFNASLGELQDTSEKRILGYKHGYLKGAPDLFILECNDRFNGLSIEFKNPNGKGIVSETQLQVKKKLNERGYKAFHSDDFHYIIKEINEYLSTRRLKCQFCIKKFKSTDTLESHHRFFHRII